MQVRAADGPFGGADREALRGPGGPRFFAVRGAQLEGRFHHSAAESGAALLRIADQAADPLAAFNLGNMLRADGRNVEAEAALQTATRIDPLFVEAWYNLGNLLGDQGRSEAAIAVQVAPQYSDAMFNLTMLLQRKKLAALSHYRQPIGMG